MQYLVSFTSLQQGAMPAPPTVDEVNCLQANGADFLRKSILYFDAQLIKTGKYGIIKTIYKMRR